MHLLARARYSDRGYQHSSAGCDRFRNLSVGFWRGHEGNHRVTGAVGTHRSAVCNHPVIFYFVPALRCTGRNRRPLRRVRLVFALLLATGCRPDKARRPDTTLQTQSPAPVAPVVSDSETPPATAADTTSIIAARLRCSPDTIRASDTLTLEMPTPHGRYLAVVPPVENELFFLVYPRLGDSSRVHSLLPSQRFRSLPVWRLPGTVRAKPWVYGRDTMELLFSMPGTYRFRLSEDLESDADWPVAECLVVFR